MFLNLLTNAIESRPDGGELSIRTRDSDGLVLVRIGDTGRGTAPDHRERIFDPEYTTKGVGVGMGLGLAIAYPIAQEHGGRIDVASTVGEGSRFTVVLPVAGK